MRRLSIATLIGLGLAASLTMAHASEALPGDIGQRLDKAPVEFTMSEAKRERLMYMQESMARQRYYDRRSGYDRGYDRGYGGPPPWAPAYGYRRHYEDRW
ncbi:MAG: hypothetical protein EOO23_02685 [Comamonadaceae bacterium]|nr:MAG: hypothetical protein EOO23_02685 [Comamonadaceae bacterium]